MKYLIERNIFKELFNKKKEEVKDSSNDSKYRVIKFDYSIGDIVKIKKTGMLGEVIAHDVESVFSMQKYDVFGVYGIKNMNVSGLEPDILYYKSEELEEPTEEEIELYRDTNKYNL